jgi:bifunctional DNA-binding transcriptional regulator/antitoxin component of YhaV-PrlF toxin-antitoxin module
MNTQKLSWEVTVQENAETGEYFLQLPPELLELQNWKEGDELEWTEGKNGSWFVSKVKDSNSGATSTVDRMR